ncbi:MAG: DUF4153 domain-containing protein [Mariniphaga sp.]
MKQKIIDHITDPEMLEKLYRENNSDFKKAFSEVSLENDSELVRFWQIRLTPEPVVVIEKFSKSNLLAIAVISLISGLLVKLPQLFTGIADDFFYPRDLAIIVFNGLILYTFWQNRFFDKRKLLVYSAIIFVLLLFVNLLPTGKSYSVILSFIHVPLFLWCLFGLSYVSFDYENTGKRIDFIRFNGELIIMTGLIILAGGVMTALTVNLFLVIKIEVINFYIDYVFAFGGVAAPILSSYLLRNYPNLTSKIAPVIARVFTPLVVITLAVYLIAMAFSANHILEDRDFLILFNVMIIAVMAIIVFSVSELDKSKTKDPNVLILCLLAILTIVTNMVALIAILTRISDGLTPNRTIVLVSNILIFVNLILLAKDLYHAYYKDNQLVNVEKTVARYLTVYMVYTLIVIFVVPFLFGFK